MSDNDNVVQLNKKKTEQSGQKKPAGFRTVPVDDLEKMKHEPIPDYPETQD